ncbi:MAG: NAD(P)H-quinone oxidoreductase subunit 3 [Candidatus Melainabacteria bacterium RIFOXYA12_FULL_32_12]|nr:MAG: NAD(P)H-quinone oxidoreductase subunit 3 [Candidatus Melainabacteria bacterium GWF2_32_7]OGI31074.1 MAG: NAD(P)H-quinone oxidoreductase subunit 3 [Candidatus Melainabacteria bacterium RIFOXYA12_FULL_32_12]
MIISGYGILVAFIIFSIAFATAALVISWLVQPKAPNKIKNSTYECGMKLFGDSRIQFDVKYYMYALLFIIFDIEAVFLFPWAVAYNKLGLFALVEALIFIVILVVGLVYAWKKDALKWQ